MAAAAGNTPADGYILGRDAAANLRINMQFYLWNDGGFILHPKIPTNVENLRVAEIGFGTGYETSNDSECHYKKHVR